MAVSWLGGGAWTLVVLGLVPLVVSPCWASPCQRWHEFEYIVKVLNKTFESCPLDCNTTQIIDRKCHCLNLNTTGNCVFSTYLISGLEKVKGALPDWLYQKMINKVNITHHHCKNDTISAPLSCHSSVSPRAFIETMNDVQQYIKSRHVQKRK